MPAPQPSGGEVICRPLESRHKPTKNSRLEDDVSPSYYPNSTYAYSSKPQRNDSSDQEHEVFRRFWSIALNESHSSSSSVHSRRSSKSHRRKQITGTSEQTKMEYNAALDTAIEAAYDDEIEPDAEAKGDERLLNDQVYGFENAVKPSLAKEIEGGEELIELQIGEEASYEPLLHRVPGLLDPVPAAKASTRKLSRDNEPQATTKNLKIGIREGPGRREPPTSDSDENGPNDLVARPIVPEIKTDPEQVLELRDVIDPLDPLSSSERINVLNCLFHWNIFEVVGFALREHKAVESSKYASEDIIEAFQVMFQIAVLRVFRRQLGILLAIHGANNYISRCEELEMRFSDLYLLKKFPQGDTRLLSSFAKAGRGVRLDWEVIFLNLKENDFINFLELDIGFKLKHTVTNRIHIVALSSGIHSLTEILNRQMFLSMSSAITPRIHRLIKTYITLPENQFRPLNWVDSQADQVVQSPSELLGMNVDYEKRLSQEKKSLNNLKLKFQSETKTVGQADLFELAQLLLTISSELSLLKEIPREKKPRHKYAPVGATVANSAKSAYDMIPTWKSRFQNPNMKVNYEQGLFYVSLIPQHQGVSDAGNMTKMEEKSAKGPHSSQAYEVPYKYEAHDFLVAAGSVKNLPYLTQAAKFVRASISEMLRKELLKEEQSSVVPSGQLRARNVIDWQGLWTFASSHGRFKGSEDGDSYQKKLIEQSNNSLPIPEAISMIPFPQLKATRNYLPTSRISADISPEGPQQNEPTSKKQVSNRIMEAIPWNTIQASTNNTNAIGRFKESVPFQRARDNDLRTFEGLHVLSGREYTNLNSLKLFIEYLTGQTWDWWPLRPSFGALQLDDVRVEWRCASGHRHWTELPEKEVYSALKVDKASASKLVNKAELSAIALSMYSASSSDSNQSSSSDFNQSSSSRSSEGRSSPITSDDSSSSLSHDDTGSEEDQPAEKKIAAPGQDVTVDIVAASRLKGYVLFGVQGSQRLRPTKTRLAQIDIEVFRDDDSFFDELAKQYTKLRGYVRYIFSIWSFRSCELIMFHKANPDDIIAGPQELPPDTDRDYHFVKDWQPLILSKLFQRNCHSCNKACMKAKLDVLRFFHECRGRNYCGKYKILERLPKRRRKWEVDQDEEKEKAWGLHATFSISLYKVVLYHCLILIGPLIFWGLWLKKWPRDWQNASVPFSEVVVLLSLFWLPFAHQDQSRNRIRKNKNSLIN